MKCYICDTEENFHSFEKLNPQRELLVCKGPPGKNCGNVLYRVEPDQEQKMKDYYRKEYRPAPNWMNILTTAHKLNYIMVFLADFIKDKKGLVCGDVGSATGYLPNHLRRIGHKATGCEYTVTFRRFSEHFYGVPLTEELETKHRYDLITIYHVLEHMVEPDKKLAHYVSLLKDDGRIMIATPQWFNILEEASGSECSDFSHLFHKDHINVFSENSLKALLKKSGLIVEKEDHIVYGQTYLLRKAKPGEEFDVDPETWEGRRDDVLRAKQAIDLYKASVNTQPGGRPDTTKLREALTLWPKFPDAWIKLILEAHSKAPDRQGELWKEVKPLLEDNCRVRQALGMWFYQQENWEAALECYSWVCERRPHEDLFMFMGWCLAHLGKPKESIKMLSKSFEIHPMKWQEAINWMCNQAVSLPCWQERAEEQVKNDMWHQNKDQVHIEAKDPVMSQDPTPEKDAPEPAAKP